MYHAESINFKYCLENVSAENEVTFGIQIRVSAALNATLNC